MKGNKKKRTAGLRRSARLFFVFGLYPSEYHCYSKCLALFCPEALDMQCSARLRRRPVSRSESGWGRGRAHRVPLCCGPPVAVGRSVGWLPYHSTSSRAGSKPNGPPLPGRKRLLQDWPISTVGHRPLRATLPEPSTTSSGSLSPSPPFFFHTRITLAGSRDSPIFGSYQCCCFVFDLIVMFSPF